MVNRYTIQLHLEDNILYRANDKRLMEVTQSEMIPGMQDLIEGKKQLSVILRTINTSELKKETMYDMILTVTVDWRNSPFFCKSGLEYVLDIKRDSSFVKVNMSKTTL